MTDDIVTQLREIKWHDAETWVDKMAQAADEIERLRKMVQMMSIDYRTQIAGIKMRCKCGSCHE